MLSSEVVVCESEVEVLEVLVLSLELVRIGLLDTVVLCGGGSEDLAAVGLGFGSIRAPTKWLGNCSRGCKGFVLQEIGSPVRK